MAWTQAQVEELEALILELAGSMRSVSVNGRAYTKRDIPELTDLRDKMKREIAAAAGGTVTLARLRRPR